MAKSSKDIRAGGAFVELGVLDKFSKPLKKAAARFRAVGAGISTAGLKLIAVGTGIAGAFGLAAKVFADAGSEIYDASKRTGIAAEQLGTLKYAADQSGASMEDLENGIRKMSKAISEARDGSKSANEALAKIGLTVEDLKNLSPDQQFRLIGDRLSKVADATTRTALAMELFGKSGTKLLPMLADGAAGLAAMEKRARELGIVMSSADAEAADAFGDALGDLAAQAKAVVINVGAAIAKALLPYMDAATRIMRMVIDWIKNNQRLVVTFAAVGAIIIAAGGALVGLGVAISSIGVVLGVAAGAIIAIKTVLLALLSPIGLVVAGLGALAYWFLTSTETGTQAMAYLADRFYELRDIAKDAFGGIADALAAGDISLAAEILWTALKLAWAVGTEALLKKWYDFRAAFVQVAAAAFYGTLSIWENVKASLEQAWQHTITFLGNLWDGFIGTFVDLWENALNLVKKGLNLLKGLFDDSFDADAANQKLDDALSKKQDERRKKEMEDLRKREDDKSRRLQEIEAERQRQVDAINKAEAEISAAAGANSEEDKRALEERLAELRRQLAELNKQAADERKQITGGFKGGQFKVPGQDDLEDTISAAGQGPTGRGTFNAAALQGLEGGGGQVAAIATNTRRTNQILADMLIKIGKTVD